MAQCEVSPFRIEKPAHDPASQDDMSLSLRAFHVGFADVA
jgi:hypothetical protein